AVGDAELTAAVEGGHVEAGGALVGGDAGQLGRLAAGGGGAAGRRVGHAAGIVPDTAVVQPVGPGRRLAQDVLPHREPLHHEQRLHAHEAGHIHRVVGGGGRDRARGAQRVGAAAAHHRRVRVEGVVVGRVQHRV